MDESDNKVLTVALLVLAGAILGAGVALLVTPQSGRETRRDISRYARKARRKVEGVAGEVAESVAEMVFLKDRLARQKPRSIKICALLDKKARREVEMEADYRGTEVEDIFIVGYGIDFNENYRHLSEIYYVTPIDHSQGYKVEVHPCLLFLNLFAKPFFRPAPAR